MRIILFLCFMVPLVAAEPKYRHKRPASICTISEHTKKREKTNCYFLDMAFRMLDKYYAWDSIDRRYYALSDKTGWPRS